MRSPAIAVEAPKALVGSPSNAMIFCSCDQLPVAGVFRRDGETANGATEHKIEKFDGAANFGSAVPMASGRIVAGAPGDNFVYVFGFDAEAGHWVQEQVLSGTSTGSFLQFGASVAIAGERIVSGEPGSGSGYVFRFTPDADGDGVTDSQDQCPNSDTRPTVFY